MMTTSSASMEFTARLAHDGAELRALLAQAWGTTVIPIRIRAPARE